MLKVAAALAITLLAGTAGADTVLTATLTNGQEIPAAVPTLANGAPRPASFGNATFTIDDAMTQMSFVATIFNIDVTGLQTPDANDNLSAAHIHAGPLVTSLANGPVVWGFFGSPQNNTSPADNVVTAFGSGVGGTFSGTWNLTEGNNTTFAAQVGNILAGRSYINFHTVQFGGGEIRGALVAPVPEPETYVLFMAGGLLLAARARQKRRSPSPRA
jgi:hypothetical protein